MKILFLGINYWPEETGIAAFNTGRCEYLAARGHTIAMCTGMPYYPEWRIAERYRGRLFTSERRNGVRILRSWLYVPRKVTSLRRILHEGSFIATATIRALGAWKPEILVVVSPPLGLAIPAILLSRLCRIPYIFHVADLQPDAAVDLGMLREGRLTRALYALEHLAYRKAALVSTLTEAMRQRIMDKGISDRKVTLFADWSEPALFHIPSSGGDTEFRRRYGLEDKHLVLHAGNMGVKQGLEVVLKAAQLSRERQDIVYLLVGDGAVRHSLEARARELSLPNVRFLPHQDKESFHQILAATDVSLVTQQRSVGDIVFPSKIRTLLAAGCPVVASLNHGSEVARVVAEAGVGLVTAAEDPQALNLAIAALLSDPGRRALMKENAKSYARRHWDRDRILAEMETHLMGLTLSQSPTTDKAPDDLKTEGGSVQ
jgi:colanic acid biosynthesis glycosyl transferase WcaI